MLILCSATDSDRKTCSEFIHCDLVRLGPLCVSLACSITVYCLPISALQMNHINAHNAEMVKHIADVEGHTALLKGQLQQTELHWNRAVADNTRLHQQMAVLSAKLKVIYLFCAVHYACAPMLLLVSCI